MSRDSLMTCVQPVQEFLRFLRMASVPVLLKLIVDAFSAFGIILSTFAIAYLSYFKDEDGMTDWDCVTRPTHLGRLTEVVSEDSSMLAIGK